MEQRLLVVSPVRNEAAHIERVALAVAGQTRRPDVWLVVDDHSTDETPRILAELSERFDFISVIETEPAANNGVGKDRLAAGAPPKAFNFGLASGGWESFTHLSKLDGDTELPPRYFELLLAEFARDGELGLAGGIQLERDGEGWAKNTQTGGDYHIRGGLKCYTRECLEAIGGIQERLGWDVIDELYARMRGYRTRTLSELATLPHRQSASADGIVRGRARHGQSAYITHSTLLWVTVRAFKVGRERPRVLSGFAFLYGYLRAMVQRVPRVEDPELRAFVHRELRERRRAMQRALIARVRSAITRRRRLVFLSSRES